MRLKKAFMKSIYVEGLNYDIEWYTMLESQKLARFDLLLPRAAIEIMTDTAARMGVSPRTLGRMLIIEKLKEMVGISPNDVLQMPGGGTP